jgi:hypothetical protein
LLLDPDLHSNTDPEPGEQNQRGSGSETLSKRKNWLCIRL